jgi:uncharacterized protein YktB (UPF0637 family)
MDNMSRKKICTMLCNMGHEMQELEVCSDAELMQMCNGMDYDMMDMGMMENHSSVNYMFFANLKSIKRLVDEMLSQDENTVDQMLTNGHNWALDHIATSKDDIEEVHGFLMDRAKKPIVNHMEKKLNIIKSWKNFR